MQSIPGNLIFDAIIIGASPLMLMQAIKLSKSGKRVCIVNSDESLGGLWQNVTLKDGTSLECACHLIEDFPGVYEALEEYSGIEFIPLIPQPVRTEATGVTRTYASRSSLLLTFTKSLILLIYYSLKKKIIHQHQHILTDILVERRLKLMDFIYYLRSHIFKGSNVQGPISGFADFTDQLVKTCKDQNIKVEIGEVQQVVSSEDKWLVNLGNKKEIFSNQVFCSASALLKQEKNRLVKKPGSMKAAYHVVLGVDDNKIDKDLTYHFFVSDPDLVRITRLDYPKKNSSRTHYLMQLNYSFDTNKEFLIHKIANKLMKIGLVNNLDSVNVIDSYSQKFQSYSILDQLPDKEIMSNLFVLSSAGNLASGVAWWLDGKQRNKRFFGI